MGAHRHRGHTQRPRAPRRARGRGDASSCCAVSARELDLDLDLDVDTSRVSATPGDTARTRRPRARFTENGKGIPQLVVGKMGARARECAGAFSGDTLSTFVSGIYSRVYARRWQRCPSVSISQWQYEGWEYLLP